MRPETTTTDIYTEEAEQREIVREAEYTEAREKIAHYSAIENLEIAIVNLLAQGVTPEELHRRVIEKPIAHQDNTLTL